MATLEKVMGIVEWALVLTLVNFEKTELPLWDTGLRFETLAQCRQWTVQHKWRMCSHPAESNDLGACDKYLSARTHDWCLPVVKESD